MLKTTFRISQNIVAFRSSTNEQAPITETIYHCQVYLCIIWVEHEINISRQVKYQCFRPQITRIILQMWFAFRINKHILGSVLPMQRMVDKMKGFSKPGI